MIEITREYTRASKEVKWHHEILNFDACQAHVNTVYVQPGKLISKTKTLSEDGLKLTYKIKFSDRGAFNQYYADHVLSDYWNLRDAHNQAIGITVSSSVVEI